MNQEHWGYILLAYGVTAVVVLTLTTRILLEYRRLRADLARLERKEPDRPSEVP